VHTSFYASGFLYHSPSRQILLQQLNKGNDQRLVLFRAKSQKGKTPQTIFQDCIEKALDITIATTSIHLVYDYIHDNLGEHFIYFAEIADKTPPTYPSGNKTDWVSLSKLSKYPMSEQTRHDIIIGERVIQSLMKPPAPEPRYTRSS